MFWEVLPAGDCREPVEGESQRQERPVRTQGSQEKRMEPKVGQGSGMGASHAQEEFGNCLTRGVCRRKPGQPETPRSPPLKPRPQDSRPLTEPSLRPHPVGPAPWPWAPPSRQVLSGRRQRYVSPISTVTSGSPRAGVGGETRPGDGAVPSTAAFSPGPGSPSPATPEIAAATAAAAPWAAIAVVEVTPEFGAAQRLWLRVSSWGGAAAAWGWGL